MENTITGTAPIARVRILNKIANKQWQHETTVELTFAFDEDKQHYIILADLLEDADALGRAESDRRTALDAHEAQD